MEKVLIICIKSIHKLQIQLYSHLRQSYSFLYKFLSVTLEPFYAKHPILDTFSCSLIQRSHNSFVSLFFSRNLIRKCKTRGGTNRHSVRWDWESVNATFSAALAQTKEMHNENKRRIQELFRELSAAEKREISIRVFRVKKNKLERDLRAGDRPLEFINEVVPDGKWKRKRRRRGGLRLRLAEWNEMHSKCNRKWNALAKQNRQRKISATNTKHQIPPYIIPNELPDAGDTRTEPPVPTHMTLFANSVDVHRTWVPPSHPMPCHAMPSDPPHHAILGSFPADCHQEIFEIHFRSRQMQLKPASASKPKTASPGQAVPDQERQKKQCLRAAHWQLIDKMLFFNYDATSNCDGLFSMGTKNNDKLFHCQCYCNWKAETHEESHRAHMRRIKIMAKD